MTSFCNARHLGAFADRFPMLEAMAAWSIAVWFKSKRRVSRPIAHPLCLPGTRNAGAPQYHYLVTFRVTVVIWVLPPPVALMVMV